MPSLGRDAAHGRAGCSGKSNSARSRHSPAGTVRRYLGGFQPATAVRPRPLAYASSAKTAVSTHGDIADYGGRQRRVKTLYRYFCGLRRCRKTKENN